MAASSEMKGCEDDFVDSRDDIPLKESGSDDVLDDQKTEYPSPAKLAPIILGLCFQSFCIALVSLIPGHTRHGS